MMVVVKLQDLIKAITIINLGTVGSYRLISGSVNCCFTLASVYGFSQYEENRIRATGFI